MTTTQPGTPARGNADPSTDIAKAALLAAGGFASTVATILVVAGTWDIADSLVKYALTMVGIIAAVALFVAAFISRR